MSIANKVNFKKGWPSSTIVEVVAQPNTGVTTLEAGMIGYLNTSGLWVLGIPNNDVTKQPFIFHNDQADGDAGGTSATPTLYNPVVWGGVHGISLANALEIETIQVDSTDINTLAVGDPLAVNASGKLEVPDTNDMIVGYVTQAKHSYQGLDYITFTPVQNRAKSA